MLNCQRRAIRREIGVISFFNSLTQDRKSKSATVAARPLACRQKERKKAQEFFLRLKQSEH